MKYLFFSLALFITIISAADADEVAPWGKAKAVNIEYPPQKVLYDVSLNNLKAFELVLDRASYLSKVYNADPFSASIIIVLHGNEINYFAIKNYAKYKDLMQRAQSLTVGGIIKFEMCRIAAKGQGYEPQDIHGFVEVVPMADAEIVRLQTQEGYAYMR